ncbi:MAG: CRISPR-associated ring nuclease Csm6 [Sutterella wadsworthensis]
MHVIRTADGRKLDDIRTPEDNTWAADCITECVRSFCARDDVRLLVSMAGGRKSMGFYAGYALSLYGRAFDGLYHVLVSPPYENSARLLLSCSTVAGMSERSQCAAGRVRRGDHAGRHTIRSHGKRSCVEPRKLYVGRQGSAEPSADARSTHVR